MDHAGGEPSTPAVVTRKLTRSYGDTVAVASLDLTIRHGEAVALLGPNGAGKSSTMRMIGCVSRPTSGSLRVLAMDPSTDAMEIKSRLGVVPQQDSLDTEIGVRENIIVYGRYFGLTKRAARERSDELLELMQLTARADDMVNTLSGGMRRRLTIARSLVNEPRLLLLDEPTTGLDPQARHIVWDVLRRLWLDGKTLLLTTHYMDEAEQLCDRVVVIDHGRVIEDGAPAELVERHCSRDVLEIVTSGPTIDASVEKLRDAASRMERLPDRVLLYVDDGDYAAAEALRLGLLASTLRVRRSGLEDVFLLLTGRSLVE